ncbi:MULTISPECIES: hypothetical protein [Pseudarthrobacter]|uniref:DUF8083 domain-containing protein n=1 Tax=Pseudarthrobacter oxydans TaxID=1671 RepID=A0AAW8NBG7_PSEOX|nr:MULTISPECIES: hypothetical protein [Pseudarthrobacter]MDR6792758.1 hypothetical protein [Pseudarthrobacter oxydans]MDR7163984.1 hypothetical protein [Pseudarthrobacter oxydans]NSX37552.1 hypothetical protein [Pseudarthrobacter oxydans]BFE43037.1 hypothetical protein GCM10017547_09300 [Pseudarthrobacter oxydans]GKV73865.1 hypothetical protein NCCP2145_32460 [Pseudarthrobacter sp. NCCP-2145]
MTGNLYRGQAGLPFSSTLRVYEPLEAFPEEQRKAIQEAGARAASRAAVENAELLASLGRITRSGGDPFPTGRTDLVRVTTAPAPVAGSDSEPSADGAGAEPVLLYCPSQLVLRAGLAANALMEGIHGPLAELLIPEEQRDKHQERIDQVKARDGSTRVHTRASTWGIPFSWFSLFMESDHKDVVESGGRIVTVRVWAPITEALERARYAVANLALAAPDLDMLDDLAQLTEWLEMFHVDSMVELDYGAVADKVYPDESPMDIRLGIECLAEGDMTGAAAAYRRLASRWIPIRQLARAS